MAAGEDNALRARHRDWCIGVAERAQPELFDPEHLALVAFEEDNLRAALHWTLETQQAASAGRLAVGLASLWLMRGRFAEGRAQLMAVAQLPSSALSPLQTSLVCGWAAVLAHNEGAYLAVEDLANRALTLAEAARDDCARAIALNQLGQAALGQGDLPRAAERYGSALAHTVPGSALAVVTAVRLGEVMFELGNMSRAEELLHASRRLGQCRPLSIPRGPDTRDARAYRGTRG